MVCKKQVKRILSGVSLSAMASFGAMMMASAAIAQRAGTDLDPLEGLGVSSIEESPSMFGSSGSPMEFIHRAILAPSMSSQDFQRYQEQVLGTEANAFRLRQQEALRQMQSPVSDTSEKGLMEGNAL